MLHVIGVCLRWLAGWIYYVCLICFAGAMLGVMTHLAYAMFFVEHPDRSYFASFGFMNGLTYGGVWAGGAAFVLCVIRARREYLASQGLDPKSLNE